MVFCTILYKKFSSDGKNKSWMQVIAIFLACLPSLTFGLHIAWTSPSTPILTSNATDTISMTLEEISNLLIVQYVTIIIACLLFPLLVDNLGRKNSILLTSVPYFISWLIITFAKTKYELYAAKVFAGIGDAGVFSALPLYIGEISEPHVRGSWGAMTTTILYLGQLLINILGIYFSISVTAAICASLSVLHVILFSLMPESPYYLLAKDKQEEAEHSLKILRWNNNVTDELQQISKAVQRQIAEPKTYKDLFMVYTNRKAFLIMTGIRMGQQLSGISAFISYNQYMFEQSGSSISKELSAIIFCVTVLIVMTIASSVLDRMGRRLSLTLSSAGCSMCLLSEAVFLYLNEYTDIDVSAFSWFPLLGLIAYIICLALGLGLLPTIMAGELFSASVKAKAVSLQCIVLAVGQLVTSKLFQVFANDFGIYAPFAFFGICSLVTTVFSFLCVPNTAGKTLEEVQQMLMKSKREGKNVSG